MTGRMIVAAAMLLVGCAGNPPVGAAAACHADAAQDILGKRANGPMIARAMRRSGARQVRRILPDSMVTMDYRTDRLNVELDAAGIVTKVRCG